MERASNGLVLADARWDPASGNASVAHRAPKIASSLRLGRRRPVSTERHRSHPDTSIDLSGVSTLASRLHLAHTLGCVGQLNSASWLSGNAESPSEQLVVPR